MAKPKSKSTRKKEIPSTLAADSPTSSGSKIKASSAGKWRALVLLGVHLLIALHIAHWLSGGSTLTPVEPSEAMAFSRASVINAGLIFFAAMILLTAVFGRFFCGWGCHLVALQDLCRHWMLKLGIRPRTLNSRVLAWIPTAAFVYMFIWPLVYRWWIADSFAVQAVELTTAHFWATFPGWVVGALTFLVCGFACVYFLGAKGFCTYACPYGAAFAAADRVAPMRIRVTDACSQCGHCTAVCSSNVRVHEEVRDWGMVVSPGCMKCRDCVSVCPKQALYYGSGPIPLFAKPRQQPSTRGPKALRWSEELFLLAVFALSFLVFRGLYGVIPFLMSLGLAGVLAFLTQQAWRLWRTPTVERPGLRLKRHGRLLLHGKAFVVAMALFALFFVHSAIIRAYTYVGDSAFEQIASVRQTFLADPVPRPSDRHEAALAALQMVEHWGLFPTYGNAAKLAWFHALDGAQDAAADYAKLALDRNELAQEMHQLLARHAASQGEHGLAVEHWEEAIAIRPDLPQAYLGLGLYQAERGDIFAAQSVFDAGVAAVPDSAELYYNAGLARAILSQPAESVPYFQRALEINPRYQEARENLAGVHASLGNFGEAVVHFRVAVEQAPDDMATRMLLARALLADGRREDALEVLRAALARQPENAETRKFYDSISGGE